MLVDDLLHAVRAGFHAEKDTGASGGGHHFDQFLVDRVGTSAASPRVALAGLNHMTAESAHPPGIDGEHIMGKSKIGDPILIFYSAHIVEHALRRTKTEFASEKVIGRAEGAGERASPPQLKGGRCCPTQLLREVICRQRD